MRSTLTELMAYCQSNDWAGYDPYDALNSRLFNLVPLLDSRLPRLALTQLLKRAPVNLRAPLLIPKTHNPKAIALFLAAFVKLARIGVLEDTSVITTMARKLIDLRSRDLENWCWGYSFPWQTRTSLVPRGAPNLVCTVFAGDALLDAFESTSEDRYFEMAASAADYISEILLWKGDGVPASLAYPMTSSRVPVHNANYLGAAFLCRTYSHTGKQQLLDTAMEVARYSSSRQRSDGSWMYGEGPKQQWIDNFHTGYNLCALITICGAAPTSEFASNIRIGYEFYRRTFFREDGAPGYFSDRTFPIDIHCAAQSIITMLSCRKLDPAGVQMARSICSWTMENMWNKKGYFNYQVRRTYDVTIPYMRWSQAWMLIALSAMLENDSAQEASATFNQIDQR